MSNSAKVVLVRACIERHINKEQLAVLRAAEASERETLGRWAEYVKGGAS